MLDIFGGEDWTPNVDHPGLFKRAGINHWATYRWDAEAEAPDGPRGQLGRERRRSASTSPLRLAVRRPAAEC